AVVPDRGARRAALEVLLGAVVEDRLDRLPEDARDAEGQRQRRIVAAVLDGVDRLPRDAQPLRQLLLRPVALRAQDAQAVLHRYLQSPMPRPRTQKVTITGAISSNFSVTAPASARKLYVIR